MVTRLIFTAGALAITRVTRRNGHEHIQAFHDLTKDTVLVIQMRSGSVCDKELRAVGTRSRICHRQDTLLIMLQAGMEFIFKFIAGSA